MPAKYVRRLVSELSEKLSDRDFLKRAGLSHRAAARLFDREKWEGILSECFPATKRFTCESILGYIRPELALLAPEPDEGWLSFTYNFAVRLLYPDSDFADEAKPYEQGAYFYLQVLSFFFDEEQRDLPFDPLVDFEFLTEDEYGKFDSAGEYEHFLRLFKEQYIYEMMRLNGEATTYGTLGHLAGVHHVAMVCARGLYKAGVPIDLALASGAAAGHDLGKFGCRPGERVPYLHYYYTNQYFASHQMNSIAHIAANHSTWDLELDNISVESLVLIYADFRVKESGGATEINTLADAFDIILSKLDNVDDAKRDRYKVVYARLAQFERFMSYLGVDIDLDGEEIRPKPLPNIALQSGEEVVTSFIYWSVSHNIDVMHRLGTEREFGNILEDARTEKDWKNIRAYLDIFDEYSKHLNHDQKEHTISFLYELLLNREGDIRRQAASLMGKMFADYNAGYRKEIPAGLSDEDVNHLAGLWGKYLAMLICPDYRLTNMQKRRIQNQLKFVLISAMDHSDDAQRDMFFSVFIQWFEDPERVKDDNSVFYLLDAVFSLPVELYEKAGCVDLLVNYALDRIDDPVGRVRIAALRCLRALSGAVTEENSCYGRICEAVSGPVPEKITEVFLRYRIRTNLRLDTKEESRILYDGDDVTADIFLENLKSGTPWIIKSVNIKLLVDQVDHGKRENLLHICAHLSNLIKVSEQIGVRYDAGTALLKLAPLLTREERNEIAVELVESLETGEYESSKYIPDYLGEFSLWLPPDQLDEVMDQLELFLSNGNEQTVLVSLDTLGVILECYSRYPKRFKESSSSSGNRRLRILGLILKCLADYRESVREEALLVVGKRIFGSDIMSGEDKNGIFSLCSKKLLCLMSEETGGELSFYCRAAALSHIYRFISHYQIFTGSVKQDERKKVAFFPGTFDPFTLSHKEIARRIREMGFTVYLAVDEFSWSKKTQPHLVRREIVNMSEADEFYIYLFPDEIPVNIANPADLRRLRDIFKDQDLYMVVGSDVIKNASAYRQKPCEDSVHSMNHIVFRRKGEENPADLCRDITGDVIELELPPALEDISSTKIRENIDDNRDISNLIDPMAQEYIYRKGLYLREPEYKPVLGAKAAAFEEGHISDAALAGELMTEIFEMRPEGQEVLSAISVHGDELLILRDMAVDGKVLAFASFHEIHPGDLYSVFANIELADVVRKRVNGNILLITGIYVKKSVNGNYTEDSAQIILAETLMRALGKNITAAVFVTDANTVTDSVISALERQGFVKPPSRASADRRTVYFVDMHEPLLLLHNIDTTIKEPFASSPLVRQTEADCHRRLQISMTKLYPGNLVLSIPSVLMQHRLVDMVTALNDVPSEQTYPRKLGADMCVPFGKTLRGVVVPNTVTKTLHTDKVYDPDLRNYAIEAFPYYAPLATQINTIKSFDRPVILVDDLVHRADRLQAIIPDIKVAGIPLKKVVVGVITGYGKDLMDAFGLPVESVYSMPNLRQWFVESSLYPFIGGDTVRRPHMQVAGLSPAVNMILPYASPELTGCENGAIFDFSSCCIENALDMMRTLESEYRRVYARNLTLERLPEAVILPLCPDKGSCMEYNGNLAASVYLENDLEMLVRSKNFMITPGGK